MDEKTTESGAPHTHSHDAGCFFCSTAIPLMGRMWSEATRDHFRNSRVEFLKGLRSLLDARIDRLSREEHRGTHVPVD